MDERWYAAVDLQGMRCGLLSDAHGAGWSLEFGLHLRLAGLHVAEVETGTGEETEKRLAWLRNQFRRQRLTGPTWKTRWREGETRVKRDLPKKEVRAFRERWHQLRQEDFVRQAYDGLASASSRSGDDRAAETIIVERKSIEATLRLRRAENRAWEFPNIFVRVGSVVLLLCLFVALAKLLNWGDINIIVACFVAAARIFWPVCLGFLQAVARYGFRYGFSAERALGVFAACILVGAGTVHYARHGGLATLKDWQQLTEDGRKHLDKGIILVLEAPYAPVPPQSVNHISGRQGDIISVEAAGKAELKQGAGTRLETKLNFVEPSPCNLDVNSLLYAADIFIPVLDLNQEERCGIRHDDPETGKTYTSWRYLKALYELLGWIVTSLLILILSGVLRRDLERRLSAPSGAEEAA
jgi:hypothetical protein